MQELLGKRLVIFAGKGGVGKTTCSAATAIHMAACGKRTLLVTVDPAKRLEDSLGVPVGFTETPIQPNLTALMLDPGTVVRQHFEERLPQAKVTDHPLFRYVTEHMPGLNELMAIGKLNDFRREGRYDCIVVDTAPTGHALSFLSVPRAMEEIMGDKSLLRWAMRGYAVWQKVSGAARSMQNVFRRKEEREDLPPEIDFEKLFSDIQQEAQRIREFLTDPENAALVIVTIPEKLPVEETMDLHAATKELGMHVHAVVMNKVQPDALGEHAARFLALEADGAARTRFVREAARATGEPEALVDRMLEATRFGELRRAMNLAYVEETRSRLPGVQLVEVPLQREDVQGLKRLAQFRRLLFPDAA